MNPRSSLLHTFRIILLSVLLGVCWTITSLAHEAQTLYNQALSQVQQKNFSEAAKSLQQALKEFPRFANAHHLLGVVLFNGLEQSDNAIKHLEQAVSLHPNFARAYLDLGLVHQHAGNFPKAKLALQKAMEIYPHYVEAQLNLAFVFDKMHATREAIGAYQAALKLNPNQQAALYNLATLYDSLSLIHI